MEQLETQLKESKQQLSKVVAEKDELKEICDKLNEERTVSQALLLRVKAVLRCKGKKTVQVTHLTIFQPSLGTIFSGYFLLCRTRTIYFYEF